MLILVVVVIRIRFWTTFNLHMLGLKRVQVLISGGLTLSFDGLDLRGNQQYDSRRKNHRPQSDINAWNCIGWFHWKREASQQNESNNFACDQNRVSLEFNLLEVEQVYLSIS